MEGGWEIPGLGQSKLVYPRKLVEFYSEKPVHLYLTGFKPEQEVIVSVPLYYRLRENDAALVIRQEQASIISIVKYELNKKDFCYEVQVYLVSYNKETGVKGYGGQLGLRYYDEDGDGKFESYDMGSGNPPFIPKIPEWVQR